MTSPTKSLWKIRRQREYHGEPDARTARDEFFVPLPASRLALAALGIIVVGLGVLAWQLWPKAPGGESAEAGFLRDMYSHHAQAVEMAMIIRDRTEDEELTTLTTEIALGQSTQMGTMLGYLALWDLPLGSTEPSMTWMGHPVEGLMPGMATDEEIAQLETLPAGEAEILFLQLMIRHHEGGVDMAQAYLERGDQDEVALMADRIVLLQAAEIDTMNYLLEQRGDSPVTEPLSDSAEAYFDASDFVGQHEPDAEILYEQVPPTGGPHRPGGAWQNCGFYSEFIENERGVHSLEHGAVWITYDPDLPWDQIDILREKAESSQKVLVSPYPGMDVPVVASVWGKQLMLDGAEDDRLDPFIVNYVNNPGNTPEPGGICWNGISATTDEVPQQEPYVRPAGTDPVGGILVTDATPTAEVLSPSVATPATEPMPDSHEDH